MAKKDALARWDEELAKEAEVAAAKMAGVGTGGGFISTRGGVLSMDGAPVPGNQLAVVVAAFKHANMYYEDEFDPDNPAVPVCYAFGDDVKTMEPHDEASDKQSAGCKGCPQNEFGSAEKGRGKACKNTVRLGLLSAGDFGPSGEGKFKFDNDPDSYTQGEARFLNLPVTSVKTFAGFMKTLEKNYSILGAKRPLPPFAVVVKVKVVPDQKSQYLVTFTPIQMVTPEVGLAIKGRVAELEESLERPFQAPAEVQPKQKGKGKSARPRF